mmetsp:Transcript_71688/g.120133  ORF Transcript_71688/g.120133 Transcript_71688/m.120133 type:complete len:238 (-) Transcript_71688:216-929(-)
MVNPRMTVGSATTYSRTPWHATCDSTMPDSGPSVCNVGDCVLVIFTRPPPGLSCLGVRNASGPRPCGCVRLVSTAETCTRTHAHAVAEVHRSHQDPVSDTRTPFRTVWLGICVGGTAWIPARHIDDLQAAETCLVSELDRQVSMQFALQQPERGMLSDPPPVEGSLLTIAMTAMCLTPQDSASCLPYHQSLIPSSTNWAFCWRIYKHSWEMWSKVRCTVCCRRKSQETFCRSLHFPC